MWVLMTQADGTFDTTAKYHCGKAYCLHCALQGFYSTNECSILCDRDVVVWWRRYYRQ